MHCPDPSHGVPWQPPSGSVPAGWGAQAPGPSGPNWHVSHAPSQAISQHTPSEQCPVAHSTSNAHGAPSGVPPAQVPPPSHVEDPGHSASGSAPGGCGAQAPGPSAGSLQVSQRSEHESAQHTPSTQKPLRQTSPAAQGVPFGWSGMQAPMAHDSRGAQEAVAQQVPSTQWPLAH